VTLRPDSMLARALSKLQIDANTSHKQAIDRLGRGLRATATASDGVIEGAEDPSLPLFLGIQWHPECLSDEPDHLAVFRLLVQKAAAK
jgi:putative glutamine amidotransferase